MSFLVDGFSTTLTATLGTGFFGNIVEEIEVTPPEVKVGEIDTTTMRRVRWRTKQPKKLKTMDKVTIKVAYDDRIYTLENMMAILGVVQPYIIAFPDGHGSEFMAWMDSFKPDTMKEGDRPTAVIELIVSNQQPNNGVSNPSEVDPIHG